MTAVPTAPGAVARLGRRAGVLAAAMLAANALSYVSTITLSRLLGPADYGVLGAVFGLLLVLSVPALALQQVVARRIAVGEPVPGLLSRAAWGGAALTTASLLTVPALTSFLHLSSPGPLAWAVLSLAPLPLASATQGVLQGSERFRRLSALFVGSAALRLALPVAAVAGGTGVTGALVAVTAANTCWAGLGIVATRGLVPAQPTAPTGGLVREVFTVVGVVGGLLLLANLDVLLARHYLRPEQAGAYAVGAIFAKITYWGPQFVAVAALPRLARPEQRTRVLLGGLAVVAGLGGTAVLLTALLGEVLVDVVLGSAYHGLAPVLWVFALLGALLAVAQLALTSGVAARTRLLWLPLTGAVLVQVLLVSQRHGSVAEVATGAIAAAGLVTLLTLWHQLKTSQRPAVGT